MVKRIIDRTNEWSPFKWTMAIAATVSSVIITGVIGYLAGGSLKAYANSDKICVIDSKVDKTIIKVEETVKGLSEVEKRLIKIENQTENASKNTELLLKIMGYNGDKDHKTVR